MSTHTAQKSFAFNKEARRRGCHGEICRRVLFAGAVEKEDAQGGLLFTLKGIKKALNKDNVVKILDCECDLCLEYHIREDPVTHVTPAQEIIRDNEALKLLAALCLMGSVFAFRALELLPMRNLEGFNRMLDNSEPTDRQLEAREKIQKSLDSFTPANHFDCVHTQEHNNPKKCLYKMFQDRFLEKRILLETPTFNEYQPDARLKRVFGDVNLPFIREVQIAAHTSPPHSFYRFEFCTAFIEREENGSEREENDIEGDESNNETDENDRKVKTLTLFRKQIRLSENTKEGQTNDQSVLNYMARQENSSIAKLLFAYTHQRDNAKYDNLIFDYYPLDLQKVMIGSSAFSSVPAITKCEEDSRKKFIAASKSLSLTEHPAWLGMLGVFEAVKSLHNAPGPVNNDGGNVIGGHFDIKPANILVDVHKDIKFVLTDFGQAKLKFLKDATTSDITGAPGTPAYQPPDRLTENGSKRLDRMYDIWSLACVLTEVLVFIKTDDVVGFREARLKEQSDPRIRVADFWTCKSRENREPCLKKAVEDRLLKLALYPDTKRYVNIIKNMFSSVLNNVTNGIEYYLQELESSNGIDESFFCEYEDPIGANGTFCPIAGMGIKISREKGEIDGRLSLHSKSDRRHESSLALIGTIKVQRTVPSRDKSAREMEEKVLVCSDTLNRKIEEVIAYSMYDHQTLSGQYRIGFRYGHRGTHISFASQEDMDMLLGALTSHYPRPESTFYQVKCTVEQSGFKSKSLINKHEPGSLHILQRLDNERYEELFINKNGGPATTQPERRDNITFQMIFHGCHEGKRRCIIIELGEAKIFHQKRASNSKVSTIEAFSGRKLHIGIIDAADDISNHPGEALDSARYPGIPLMTERLEKFIMNGKPVSSLLLEFEEFQHRQNFEKIFEELFV